MFLTSTKKDYYAILLYSIDFNYRVFFQIFSAFNVIILMNVQLTKSPIHWIGGKKKLLHEIFKYIPNSFNNYFEPFLGSGIVFLNIPKSRSCRSYINDFNTEIINIFRCIRDNPQRVTSRLLSLEKIFIATPASQRKLFFQNVVLHLFQPMSLGCFFYLPLLKPGLECLN